MDLDSLGTSWSPSSYTSVFNELAAAYERESDRAAAVLAVSFLDCKLGENLPGLLIDDGAARALLKRSAGTLHSRIELAYCLGTIPSRHREDMHTLREIRNYFAHHPGHADFSTEEIKTLCDRLRTPMRIDGMPNRKVCLMAVAICMFAAMFGGRFHTRPVVPSIGLGS